MADPDSWVALTSSGPISPAVSTTTAARQSFAKVQKNVSYACTACQARKSKCTGDVPCRSCVAKGTECSYSDRSDGRRSAAIKKKQEAIDQDRDLLHSLIAALRRGNDAAIQELLVLARGGASLEAIRICVGTLLGPQGYTEESVPDLSHLGRATRSVEEIDGSVEDGDHRPSRRRKVFDVTRMTDIPLYQVPAKPWTSVDIDDALVSHLVSLYFTWNQNLHRLVDPELFVRDMQSGEIESEYCSPFLVNAILANACPYSDYEELKTRQGCLSAVAEALIAEAKQHLDDEAGHASLASIQGLWVLSCITAWNCRDRQSFWYMRQHIVMCEEYLMEGSSMKPKSTSRTTMTSEMTSFTVQTIFNSATTMCLCWQIPPLMQQPPLRSAGVTFDVEDAWHPYPNQGDALPHYATEFCRYFFQLAKLNAALAQILFDGHIQDGNLEKLTNAAATYHGKYEEWYRNLPERMCVRTGTTPGVLGMHNWYHAILITLYAPLTVTNQQSVARTIEHARIVCRGAALQIGYTMKVYCELFGSGRIPSDNIHPLVLAIYTLMDDLQREDHDYLVLLCKCLRACARRWPFGMGVLRIVQVRALEKNIVLPSETRQMFEDFETQEWRGRERMQVSSMYPDFSVANRRRVGLAGPDESWEMEEILKQLEVLELRGGLPRDASSQRTS